MPTPHDGSEERTGRNVSCLANWFFKERSSLDASKGSTRRSVWGATHRGLAATRGKIGTSLGSGQSRFAPIVQLCARRFFEKSSALVVRTANPRFASLKKESRSRVLHRHRRSGAAMVPIDGCQQPVDGGFNGISPVVLWVSDRCGASRTAKAWQVSRQAGKNQSLSRRSHNAYNQTRTRVSRQA